MTFSESIPVAKQLAERSLSKGFDFEAFMVLCEINKFEEIKTDLVPGTNIDECIQTLLNLFVTYYNNRNETTLKPLLTTLQQILSELYHTCTTSNEKAIFKNFITNTSYIK